MSEETLTTETATDTPVKGVSGGRKKHDEHGHLTDFGYVSIFIVLAIITAVEVAFSYIDMPTPVFLIALFAMMIVKFYLVAAEFMHLKYDHGHFTKLFVTGLVLAVGVYMIFMSASQLWQTF